jgi:WG containing repeat
MCASYKQVVLSTLVLIALNLSASAQDQGDPVPECGLGPWQMCRYVDPVTSHPLTEPEFQLAAPFYEGRAAIRVDGLFGFVDTTGRIVIPPTFEQVSQFRHGLAEVSDGVSVDLIDKDGRLVLATDFRRAIPISSTVVMAFADDRDAAAEWENSGQYLVPQLWRDPEDESVFVYSKAGLYSIESGWMATPPVRSLQLIPGASRSFWLQVAEAGDGWDIYDWGLMGDDGAWIIGPGIMDVVPLQGGLSVIFDPPTGTREAHDSYFGHELDRNQGGWEAIIDENGQMLGGQYFANVGMTKDLAPAVWRDDSWYNIDREGKYSPFEGELLEFWNHKRQSEPPLVMTIDRAWDDSGLACTDGVTLFSQPMPKTGWWSSTSSPFNLGWGLIDGAGELMVPAEHRYITCPQHGIALVPDTARGQWCPVGPRPQAATSGTCQVFLWDGMIREMASHEKLDEDPFESEVKWWQQQLLWSQFPELVAEPKWVLD